MVPGAGRLLGGAHGRPRGVGFLTWALSLPALEEILELGPTAVMLSFGDPGPFSSSVRDSGATLIVQVTDRDEARRALDVGADIVVAQGRNNNTTGKETSTSPARIVPRGSV
jgi:nitronate monooxygenase